MGLFEAAEGEVGRIHFAPAIPEDKTWVDWRSWVQTTLNTGLAFADDTGGDGASLSYEGATHSISKLAGQSGASWPALSAPTPPPEPEMVYVQAQGPRFETRSEIRSYIPHGHIVGMTCANEWCDSTLDLQRLDTHVETRLHRHAVS